MKRAAELPFLSDKSIKNVKVDPFVMAPVFGGGGGGGRMGLPMANMKPLASRSNAPSPTPQQHQQSTAMVSTTNVVEKKKIFESIAEEVVKSGGSCSGNKTNVDMNMDDGMTPLQMVGCRTIKVANIGKEVDENGNVPDFIDDDEYYVTDEARNFFNNIKGRFGIVTVVGRYRTGKSAILNKCLLQEKNGRGFDVGSTTNSCTKGL